MTQSAERHVLQFCHGYDGPFLDCARQYASLFAGRGYRVTTVFLTGKTDAAVVQGCASDEVLFLEQSSKSVRGLKLRAIAKFKRIAAARRFEFCIAHRAKPIYIALLATRLPVIGVHHAFGDYQRKSRRVFANLFRRRLSLLGVSDAVRDDLRRCLPGWAPERIETLYNRIDVDAQEAALLAREQARAALELPADAWIIGNVGRLHPDKDQATLLRGFAVARERLPGNALLAIMGSGQLESSLRALAVELGIADHVRFLGQIADGRRYFLAFDIFALSSDHEPFGMVLLEAMAAGLPLLVTNCGGAREIVEGVGILFPLGDAERLGQGLIHLASLDESQWQACVESMHHRLESLFSDTVIRDRFWTLPMVRGLVEA